MESVTPDSHKPWSKDLFAASDTELIRYLRAGQQKAFEILYERYGKLVYSTAWKILNNASETEDVTQDVFVTLWQRDIYNPNRGSLSSFLCLLTRSRAIDKLRKQGTTQKFLERWQQTVTPDDNAPTPFEKATLNERQELIHQAIRQLPPPQQQVLEMVYYTGLSQNEIATQLNIPLGTVKTRSRQGLLKLGKLLQNSVE